MYAGVLLLGFLVAYTAAQQADYCYAEDEQPYLRMATKTPYHFVHNESLFRTIPNCEPLQIWVLARHGTRYPGNGEIRDLKTLPTLRDQIVYNHRNLSSGHLCDTDLENLESWSFDPAVTEAVSNYLTPQGVAEFELLAKSLRSNFPGLLQPDANDINAENYRFQSTDTQRSQASMDSFMETLFGSSDAVDVTPSNYTLLKGYKDCEAYQTEVKNNPDAIQEVTNFGAGPEIENVLHNVSLRLGFSYNITSASVSLMYDMCRYEKAWRIDDVSPWCAVFSEEELRVLEYQEDLKYYYNTGYGNELNHRLGCPPMQDMFEHFTKLEGMNSTGEPKGIFYFSHSSMLQLFTTAMGFAEDSTPLTANNYETMSERQWRTSEIGVFATNVVAVFYKCDTNESSYKVMFYLSSKPVVYEGCEDGLCDWEYLKSKLGEAALSCSLDFCQQVSGASSLTASVLAILISLLVLPRQ